MPDPVTKSILAPCPPETAFRIFIGDLARWWPVDSHSVSAGAGTVPRSVDVEACDGGVIRETCQDGSIQIWGSIARYDPPKRLEILWHVGRPADQATTITVTFAPEGQGTRVTLVHDGWQALGDQAEAIRNGYATGWIHVFEECYGSACTAPSG